MRRRSCSLPLVALAMSVAGCATPVAEPRPLSLVYDSRHDGIELAKGAVEPCVWIEDQRRQTSFYGYDISSSDTTSWLQAGVLNQFGAKALVGDVRNNKGMHLAVTRAYVNPGAYALTGVVVLRATWGENDQVYRGQETRTNWWGSDKELQNVLTVALDNALGKVTLPVGKSRCEETTPG